MNNGDILKKYAYGDRGQAAEDLSASAENYEQENALSADSSTASAGQVAGILFGVLRKNKFAVAIFIIVIAAGYGVYEKYFNLTDAEIAQKELAIAVEAVGELMILPEGDEPVLATVTDAETLIKQQAFFTGAMDGDQLLLFPKNMKAVIYSPSRNKIINAGPIEQQAQNQESRITNQESQTENHESRITNQETQIQNSPTPLKIAFYNGTKIVGLANEMESRLKSVSSDFETVVKINAENKDYKKTIVIDLTGGTKSAEAQSIALALGATTGSLPEGETSPDADILVIAGK